MIVGFISLWASLLLIQCVFWRCRQDGGEGGQDRLGRNDPAPHAAPYGSVKRRRRLSIDRVFELSGELLKRKKRVLVWGLWVNSYSHWLHHYLCVLPLATSRFRAKRFIAGDHRKITRHGQTDRTSDKPS